MISLKASAGSIFYAFDIHGNVAQRLNSSGSVVSTQMFDAFGNRASTDSNTDPYAGFEGQYGCYTDSETGLELLTYRYYDPSSGRFLTRDPVEFRGGINFYEYGDNNPGAKTDPAGLFAVPILGGLLNCLAQVQAILLSSCNDSKQDACSVGADCVSDILVTMI